jgi:[ribosomal protein S5]-alanine N-acetyltransferase
MQIETKRLRIRPITLDEAPAVARLVTEKISQWTSPVPWPYTLRDAEWWISHSDPIKRLGIYLLPGPTLIGATNLPIANGDEVGFWINGQYEGQGYATEAAAAVISHVFANSELDYLESGVHRDNLGSRRVHEKLGFTITAEEQRQWPNKTAPVPVVVYRLDRFGWKPSVPAGTTEAE